METLTVRQPYLANVGPAIDRAPQTDLPLRLPADTRIISADGHWEFSEDIFYENFPAHLKDRAPRIWFDGYRRMGKPERDAAKPLSPRAVHLISRSLAEAGDVDKRLADLSAEGVEMEICFPQSLLALVRHPDPEVLENICGVYNAYIADRLKPGNGRLFGVGVFRNWWDPERAEAAMQQIIDLGLKTFMLPMQPGSSKGPTQFWSDPAFDRMWSVIAEAGLPVCFHLGEGFDINHRGGMCTDGMAQMGAFRRPFGQMIFGGVFDRNPTLKVVFAESGLAWIPVFLQDAEMMIDTHVPGDLLDPIERRPTDYWRENCYVTFQMDPLGLSQMDLIGADRVMWASDYPHSEGTFGYGRTVVQSIVDKLSPSDARKVLGGNALKVFNLA